MNLRWHINTMRHFLGYYGAFKTTELPVSFKQPQASKILRGFAPDMLLFLQRVSHSLWWKFKILAIIYLSEVLFKHKWPFIRDSLTMQNTNRSRFRMARTFNGVLVQPYKCQGYLQNPDWGLNVNVCIKFRGLEAWLSASELPQLLIGYCVFNSESYSDMFTLKSINFNAE